MSAATATAHWARPFIGKPWREDAEGPEAYDCKGLVRAVQRQRFGREVPALQVADTRTPEGRAAFMDAVRRGGWARLQVPADDVRGLQRTALEGDILVCQAARGAHVGVFITVGRQLAVLHARADRDADGVPHGSTAWQPLADLLACGFSRPELWRYQP